MPKFRAEGVPLDVLVIDTDFKSPDRWNGWEIDPAKFPDPKALLRLGARAGPAHHAEHPPEHPRHATRSSPPARRPPRASCSRVCATAAPTATSSTSATPTSSTPTWACTATWSRTATTSGGWTGAATTRILAGRRHPRRVDQPAVRRRPLRGFAFSRAYGSLQAGGYGGPTAVPTGPWADKRTTLHFTGDTTSDWATLQFEVGYTPGESAATGLAAISHDIGGHTNGLQEPGSEPGSTKLPDDLYARWVQFGTFQPIDRLHSNHSDRLPWQYGRRRRARPRSS